VLTTVEGAERVTLSLLHAKTGWFHRLCQEYEIPPIAFDQRNIHILRNSKDEKLKDIRTPQDNQAAADFIIEKVRAFTADAETELHVSMAGGRKTMGFYVGYALSLFGRKQDRLSHVLVNAPFESHPEFYYPTRESHVIHLQGAGNKPIDTCKAEITLANIPFVRMQEGIHEQLDSGKLTYSKIVASAQSGISQLKLRFWPRQKRIEAHRTEIKLSASEYAFYWWLADRQQHQRPGVHWSQNDLNNEFLSYYQQLEKAYSGTFARTRKALEKGMDKDYFESKKAKINRKIKQQLGKRTAQSYLISRQEAIPGSSYSLFGLILEVGQIEILRENHEEKP